jgi:hypothetical protein
LRVRLIRHFGLPVSAAEFHSSLRRLADLAVWAFPMEVVFMAGMVGFCGSRDLPVSAADSALVAGVVGSVLAGLPRRGVALGCAVGGDALVVSSALAVGASSRLRVFAAFGPVSPPWPAARVLLPARLPPSQAWPKPSPQAPSSHGGPGAVPRFPSPAASPPAPQLSSWRSPRPARAAASSGSSPHYVRPASVPLLLRRRASPAPVPGRGPRSRSPRVSVSPS